MVKKNYIAPAANEIRTKLRTTILAGSNGIPGTGAGSNPSGSDTSGELGTGSPITGSGTIPGARQRGASSID